MYASLLRISDALHLGIFQQPAHNGFLSTLSGDFLPAQRRCDTLKVFLKKNWFFVGIAVVMLMAFCLPRLGQWVQGHRLLDYGIFLAFLITGLTLETSAVRDQLRRFTAPLVAMISSFVLIPALAWLMGSLTLSEEFLIGVCIIATAPVTVASGTVMTYLGRGNVPLSIFICVLGNALGVFTIPVSLNLLLRFGAQIELPVLKMLGGLALTILLPTILGQLIRPFVKEKIAPYRKAFSIFQQCLVLLIIFNAMASSATHILQAGLAVVAVLAFTIVLHSLVLLMNYSLSRLLGYDRPSVTAFTIHASQKTLAVSYLVWSGYFAAQFPMALIPGIGYHLTQMIMDSVVAHRFRIAADRADEARPPLAPGLTRRASS
jgi:solute carrier family 10 (sodium/bile acid cotransporter), member 7